MPTVGASVSALRTLKHRIKPIRAVSRCKCLTEIVDRPRRAVEQILPVIRMGAAMDRSAVLQSPAYAALTPSGKRCLHLIEDEVERCGGAARIPRKGFMAVGISKAAVSFGIKQCERLGFVSVTVGLRHANVFVLLDDWRLLDAAEAARRVKLARLPKPPRVAVAEAAEACCNTEAGEGRATAHDRAPRAVAAAPVIHGRRSIVSAAGCRGLDRVGGLPPPVASCERNFYARLILFLQLPLVGSNERTNVV